MTADDLGRGIVSGRAREAGLIALGVAVSLVPYLGRLKHPTLYTDDVVRIAQLRTNSPGRLLFLPFNEHMAPMFQGLSWLTWHLAGEELTRAPLAFTLASYVPFVLSLLLLARVIRAETRSVATAMASLALFSLSWLASETVYWYSASSFMWALALTLAAWLGAVSASSRGGRPLRGALGMALAAALAPAFSAIGLLAGPLALVRTLVGREGAGTRRRAVLALAPIAGTLTYLAVCSSFRYGDVLAASVERNIHIRPGLSAAVRAPVDHLLPGLFLVRPTASRLDPGVSLALSVLGILGLLVWPWRSPHPRRGLILGGLLLILGGYGLTFCARGDPSGRSVLVAQRYHLFPQLGLVLVLAPVLRSFLGRREDQGRAGLQAVTLLALVLALVHAPMLKARGKFYRFPEQARTLAALDRLATLCRERGITRAVALAALDPIQPAWSPPNYNALEMLAGTGAPADEIPDSARAGARAALLTALTPAEREALCGGMDASPYLRPLAALDPDKLDRSDPGRLKDEFRVRAEGPGRWIADGWPSYLEYELLASDQPGPDVPRAPIRAIGLPLEMPGGSIEIWWRGDQERWSESRSVRCRLDPSPSRSGRGWSLPTDRLPHWCPGDSLHLRVFFRTPGAVAMAAPMLLR